MNIKFTKRIENTPKSFIREILKVTTNPEIISFAGGLPNPLLFPVEAFKEATSKVLEESGQEALQYSTTEGFLPLREFIANRYNKRFGINVSPDEILITNGSQQGLDLIGKILINDGDDIIIEKPGYLGAIQAFSLYQPRFHATNLDHDGVDLKMLEEMAIKYNPKFFYCVPNFQNPSGLTYSIDKRIGTANISNKHDMIIIEDDPYGELRFIGDDLPPIKSYNSENTVMLGSFSKIIAPGLRLGWICAKKDIMEKLVIAKQAADLHSNYFSQRIIHRYLLDNNLNAHIKKIKEAYKKQRNAMVSSMEEFFPDNVEFTKTEGGMFVWVKLPNDISAMELFNVTIKDNVAFVPGDPFYVNFHDVSTLRLNYTNADEDTIHEGIKRLAKGIKSLII